MISRRTLRLGTGALLAGGTRWVRGQEWRSYPSVASPSGSGIDAGCAAFVFLHGGGFREGDRAHYGFVAEPLASIGVVRVVAGYRLAPDAAFPEPVELTIRPPGRSAIDRASPSGRWQPSSASAPRPPQERRARASSSMVCRSSTVGASSPTKRRICTRHPILPETMVAAPVSTSAAALRRPSASAMSGCSRL